MSEELSDLTELVRRADGADAAAADQLFSLLYAELRRLAERHLQGGRSGLTLSTTTLVHETYLRMAGRTTAFPDRARFFAYASRAMRGLVVDYARRRGAKKRDRGFEITLVDGAQPAGDGAGTDVEALSDALDELAALDPALAEVVDLHFFGGF
ncbi:MAG: ECF-type sigma factor, partial [Gemmatimonadales bacterium]